MHTLDLRQPARDHSRALDGEPALTAHPHLNAAAVRTWGGRMLNEYRSARVFEGLAGQLEAAGVDAERVAQCRSFADEERRHGVLCGSVVEALGGTALAEHDDPPPWPEHAAVSRTEAALRNLLSICCLSETIAVSLIGAERLEMPDGPLRELLTQIYADECGHANFGWRLLPDLLPDDPEMRARLGEYLVVAFAHLEDHELAHLPTDFKPPPEGVALGLCSGSDARGLFYDTVEAVIIPALEAQGLGARSAWERRREEPASA
jgi:hypothetical protein